MNPLEPLDFAKSYGSSYCIPLWLRDIQIHANIAKIPGRVEHCPEKNHEPVAIVGYGPSLAQTWEKLHDFNIIFSTSGAHRFLVEKGVIPTYHVDVDPRRHKVDLLGAAHPGVIYLPCSTVHPAYTDFLIEQGAQIRLWHCFSTELEALRILPQGEYTLTGGADAGMRAMAVARFMGYVNQHVFGMDGCADDERAHAGDHSNPMLRFFDLEFNGQHFRTTPHLLDVAKTVPHEVRMLKLDRVEFHGRGLVQALMADQKPEPCTESTIAFLKPKLISDGWVRELRLRHAQCPVYGSDGFRYADTVRRLVEATGARSVLDYGCGKGVLAAKLDFPIWEYDPAISGKDGTPKAADLVICTNVLDTVEDDHLGDVIADLVRCVRKVGYFVMAPGRAEYWRAILEQFFYIGKVVEESDGVVAVVGPKFKETQKTVSVPAVQWGGINPDWRYTNAFAGRNMPAITEAH